MMTSKTDLSAEEPSTKRLRIAPEATAQSITGILPNDVLRDVLGKFLGPGHRRYVAGTCRVFRNAYESAMRDEHRHKTTWESAAASVPCAELCLGEATENFKLRSIAFAAARSGQIDVLELCCNQGFVPDCSVFSQASACGQLNVFEFAVAKGLQWNFFSVANNAAEAGHVYLMEWMREHDAHSCFRFCDLFAARGGRVFVFEWLKRLELVRVENVIGYWYEAIKRGHVQVLDWLLENGYSSQQPRVMDAAAMWGQISVFQWALDYQIEMSNKTCARAAFHGHLEAVKWLRKNGCSWDGNVIHWAQEKGNSDIAGWARNNGCPTEMDQVFNSDKLGYVGLWS
jgi:hypothetical protein